jgi:hypothetical protein
MGTNSEKKKILIINWRFNDDEKNSDLIEVEKDKEIVYSNFKKIEISFFCDFIIKHKDYNDVLVFTHTGFGNEIKKIDINLNYPNIKIFEFSGGTNIIYGDRGLINSGWDKYAEATNEYSDDQLKINFDNLWDEYWNKIEIVDAKKKLIDTFLPLAIDIQGLSEVKEESYFNEIKESLLVTDESGNSLYEFLTKFPESSLSSAWNEISQLIDPDYRGFSPKELALEIYNNDFNTFLKSDYLKTEESFFLPMWLQHVVSMFDEKIDLEKK